MAENHDDVVLSESEREQLAEIEATLASSDPELGGPLGRQEQAWSRVRLWKATLLVMLGSAVVVATFTRWLWMAVAGLALMAAGGLLLARPLAARVRAGIGQRGPIAGDSAGARR